MDEEEFTLPSGHLSPTSISMYIKCAKSFEFRYVDGLKSPPAVAMAEGSSHHEVLKFDNEGIMGGKSHIPAKKRLSLFVNSFEKSMPEIENWEGDTKDKVISRGKAIIERYCSHVSSDPIVEVSLTEEKFEESISGVPIVGIIDFIGRFSSMKGLSVWDYKFSNKAVIESELKHNLQLGLYLVVKGGNSAGLIRNERKEKGNIQIAHTTISPANKKIVTETVVGVARGINAGSFPATEHGNWWCSEKWCGYWSKCRGCSRFQSKIIDMGDTKKPRTARKKAKAKR
jgi:RecB family exonuclease